MGTDVETDTETTGLNWTEKYRPRSIADIQGHNTALAEIERWAEEWTPGDEPLLLLGPPGIGKTATAQALANDMGWSMTEINASSDRTQADLAAIAQQLAADPIEGRELLFLDEVDAFASQSNLQPLLDELAAPSSPVILAANEEWKVPNAITRRATSYEFSLGKRSIKARLKQICEAEGVGISSMDLGKLATRGNLRAAINDLQQYAETGELDWDQRRTEVGNFEVVDNVLRGTRFTGNVSPPKLVQWLDENLSNDFRGIEAAMAYDALSRADKWLGRCSNNEYRWWRYAGRLADQTAALRLTEPYDGYLQKNYPQHFRESTPSADDNTAEAALYRRLKGYESGGFEFAGDYQYFRRQMLPQLLATPTVVRRHLAVEYGLHPDDAALEALGLESESFDAWLNEPISAEQVAEHSSLEGW